MRARCARDARARASEATRKHSSRLAPEVVGEAIMTTNARANETARDAESKDEL